jgi:hypothetical protein
LRKSKKPARRREPLASEAYRLKSSPAAFVGLLYADTVEAAIAAAVEEHDIKLADEKRLFARPRR